MNLNNLDAIMENVISLKVNVDLQNPNNFEDLPSLLDIQNLCDASIQTKTHQRAVENRVSVLIRVVDNVESENLNQNYRAKEGPTNVLSFPNEVSEFMSDIPELAEQASHLGDLVICEPLVRREATEQNKKLQAHWAHLIIHGVLHLQGFDHIDDQEATQMEALEIQILEQIGFANPYTNLS